MAAPHQLPSPRNENREEVRAVAPEGSSRSSATSRTYGTADCTSFAICSREGVSGRASSATAHALQAALPEEVRRVTCRGTELIRRRAAELHESPLPTSLAGLDHLLGGGLPRGGLVELVGRGSCGRFAALLAALQAVTGAGEAAALIDQGEQLDPQTAVEVGVDLEHLLWVRPQNLRDSLAAAELLVHTGFPLVTLDLGLPPVRGRVPLAAWLRLARNAAAHGATVLVGSPYRLSGCAADVVVAGGHGRGTWSAGGGSARLLSGLRARLHLARRVGHPNHESAPAVLTLPDAAFGPAASVDPMKNQISDLPPTHPRDSALSEIEEKRREKHVTAL